jgi:hypothetical protein
MFSTKNSALKKNFYNSRILRYFDSRTHFEQTGGRRNINSEFVWFYCTYEEQSSKFVK